MSGGTTVVMELFQAALNGDVAELRRLVANGRNVNERDADGCTALHYAANNGHVEVLQVLLEQLGADKDAKDVNGATALHWAALYGRVEALRVLVQMGADKDAKDVDGGTPLHNARSGWKYEAVDALIELGADVNVPLPALYELKEILYIFGELLMLLLVFYVCKFLFGSACTSLVVLLLACYVCKRLYSIVRTLWPRVRPARKTAAELLEEAAKTKVRVAPPSPHIGLHSVQLGGERCGVSVARVSVSPLTA